MSCKYYAHFVTEDDLPPGAGEYSGVVEVRAPLRANLEMVDLRVALARSFQLMPDEIRILNWATLH